MIVGNATYEAQSVFDSVLHSYWSDDAGRTWTFGSTPDRLDDGRPARGLNETSIAATANGEVVLSIRAYCDEIALPERTLAWGGPESASGWRWHRMRSATGLTAPPVQGSIAAHPSPASGVEVVACHPSHPRERRGLTLHALDADGNVTAKRTLRSGFSGYSDVAAHPSTGAWTVIFESSPNGEISVLATDPWPSATSPTRADEQTAP